MDVPKPVCDAEIPLEVAFLCIHCHNFSQDFYNCTSCGKLMSNVVDVKVVSEADNNHVTKVIEDKTETKKSRGRRREINCYGMYLKEQKELNLNISKKLDSEAMVKKWKSLSDSEKAVYKSRSLEDKAYVKASNDTSERKYKKKKSEPDVVLNKKVLRNKRDTELKAQKRDETMEVKKDLFCARNMLTKMIAEKKANMLTLSNEVEVNEKEITDVSNEIRVSERLLKNKREKLSVVKKEYRELYAGNVFTDKQ